MPSSSNTLPSWTAYVTTRKWLHVGLSLNNLNAFALHCGYTCIHHDNTRTTSSWTATSCPSKTNRGPRSPLEIWNTLKLALPIGTIVPSVPLRQIEHLWATTWPQDCRLLSEHITHRDITRFCNTFPGAVFHNEDKRATSLRIYCPCLYFQCLSSIFSDPAVFRRLSTSPTDTINTTIEKIRARFMKTYPWALGAGGDLPNAYVLPKRKKKLLFKFAAGRPIVSFFTLPVRPMLNCIAKLLYQLIPATFPHNLARGDV